MNKASDHIEGNREEEVIIRECGYYGDESWASGFGVDSGLCSCLNSQCYHFGYVG